MIQTLLFDLGNVLIPFELSRGYRAFETSTGLPAQLVAERLTSTDLYQRYEAGRVSTPEFHKSISEVLQVEIPLAELRTAWNAIFFPDPTVNPELLIKLKENYRLVLLSNTNELHFDWLRERCAFLQLFDAFTLSYEVGAMKPERLIFEDALSKARCAPEECFYTDDILKYVETARTLGIHAQQFTGEDRLREHLTAAGVRY